MPPAQVISGLRQAKAQAQNVHVQRRAGMIAITLLPGYFVFLLLFYAALGWSFGDWQDFDIGAPIIGGLILFILLIVIVSAILMQIFNKRTENVRSLAQKRQQASKALLTALPVLDDTLAPPVERSEAPDLDVYLPLKRRRIALPQTLQLQPTPANYPQILISMGSLLIPLLQMLQIPSDAIFAGMNISIRQEGLILLPVGLTIIAFLLLGISLSLKGFRRLLYLDEQGVWWRRWRGWAHMPWTGIRTIGVYQRESANDMKTTYIIDAEEQLISWTIQTSSSAEMCAGSSQLLQFAEARSGAFDQCHCP